MASDPVTYRSGCGCAQRESGRVDKCLRHLQADWDAGQTLAADPVESWYDPAHYQAA